MVMPSTKEDTCSNPVARSLFFSKIVFQKYSTLNAVGFAGLATSGGLQKRHKALLLLLVDWKADCQSIQKYKIHEL